MQGMIVGDYHSDSELMHAFRQDMAQYVQEGKVKVHEHVTDGIENAGRAFIEVGGDSIQVDEGTHWSPVMTAPHQAA
jgi:NADPH-dependent curcumin reductase CurA